ncbi:MAG: hypothetical protein AAB466_07585 [Verrucomicrobiota bacterium]
MKIKVSSLFIATSAIVAAVHVGQAGPIAASGAGAASLDAKLQAGQITQRE